MKPKNERTSARIGKIAGRVLKSLEGLPSDVPLQCVVNYHFQTYDEQDILTVGELKSLAASCLTQRPDKKAK